VSGLVRVEVRAGAHILTLSRPDKGNSLSEALVQAIHDAIDAFQGRGGRVLVVQGDGDNFCTGFNLGGLAETTDAALLLRFVRIEQLLARIWTADFATIAVARGRVSGAGADLFAACATRIAVEGARFSFPGAAFGLVLGTRRLAERVGRSNAQWLVSSGGVVDGAKAAEMGLVTDLARSEAEVDAKLDRAIGAGLRLDPTAYRGLRQALCCEAGLDADLALLVRSAARPGLRERILDYRSQSIAAAKKSAAPEA